MTFSIASLSIHLKFRFDRALTALYVYVEAKKRTVIVRQKKFKLKKTKDLEKYLYHILSTIKDMNTLVFHPAFHVQVDPSRSLTMLKF